MRRLCPHNVSNRGSQVLVHECTFDQTLIARALSTGHSTTLMAGEFATRIETKVLILTHFSNRYSEETEVKIEDLRAEASTACPKSKVLAAHDGMTYELNIK